MKQEQKIDQAKLEVMDICNEIMQSERHKATLFNKLMEDISIIAFALYKNRFVCINPYFEQKLGYSKSELFDLKMKDVIHSDFQNIIDKDRNNSKECEIEFIKKNGQKIWLKAFTNTLEIDGKEIIVATAYEMTRYMQTKEKLKLKEAQYENIINMQTELVIRSTVDQKCIFVNDAYCRYFNLERENVIGKNMMLHIYEKDYEKAWKTLDSICAERPFISIDVRVNKGDGKLYWIEWKGQVFYDDSGKAIEYQVVGRDITERKKVQEELKKFQNQLELKIGKRTCELSKVNKELTLVNGYMKSILMHMSEGVAIIDESGNFDSLNNILEKNCAISIEEIKEYFKKMIQEKRNIYINKMLKENEAFYDVEFILSTRKTDVQFLISGTPLDYSEDDANKAVIIIRPIKEVHELVNHFSGAQARFHFDDVITNNEKMLKTVKIASKAALGNGNILIQGESGTGKELFAQAIHNRSSRSKGPFVAVNCGAIPRDLIGSELFGYAEGAFTGAKKGGKPGKFELASGGTIFLDEIGDMPFEQQVALLRVIQEKRVIRISGEKVIPIDVRVVCATNKNLFKAMNEGNFRQDLYYRLNVISITIPPLRERREDIALLFKYFLIKMDKKWEEHLQNIDPLVMEYLMKYDWHGNVRELQNMAERIDHITQGYNVLVEYLPENIIKNYNRDINEGYAIVAQEEVFTINEIVKYSKKEKEEKEGYEIFRLLKQEKGNISKAAKNMGISRSTLYRKMKKYKISKK